MEAPDWYNPRGGRGQVWHPPPPPLPGQEVSMAPPPLPKRAARDAAIAKAAAVASGLPQLPSVPSAPGQPGSQLALPPPPGAPPALAALPNPPPPPGAAPGAVVPSQMQTGGGAGGGIIALALNDATQAAVANGQILPRTAASMVKAKPPAQDEKPFEIWGLQHKPYSEEDLREAFEMLDLDKHGYIGPQDIRRVLDLCGEGDAVDAEVREMLRLVDSDARGKVDYDEFADQFIDPPPVFRNFDIQKRNAVGGLGEKRASSAASTDPFVTDLRGHAVKDIMGKRKLTPEFIKQVYQRFVEMDVDERGFVSFEDFCFILRRAENETMRRAFDAFDFQRIGELDLRYFIIGLSMYTTSSTEEKLKFAFMMFDEEQTDQVQAGDVQELFKAMSPHLSEDVRTAHVKRMYQLLSLNPSQGLMFDEFLDYALEYADELVPASPSPSSVSRTTGSRSSGTRSSGSATPTSHSGSRKDSVHSGSRSGAGSRRTASRN